VKPLLKLSEKAASRLDDESGGSNYFKSKGKSKKAKVKTKH